MTESKRFGLRVKELRRLRDHSQASLAAACNGSLSLGAIRDIEQGKHHGPSWATVLTLSRVLGFSVQEFVLLKQEAR